MRGRCEGFAGRVGAVMCACGTVGAVLAVTSVALVHAAQSEVHAEYGGPIREYIRMLIRPGDDRVIVIDRPAESASFSERPSVREALDIASGRSDLVGVVEVSDVRTEVSERDTWIRSRLRGRLTEVLRGRPTFAVGTLIELFDGHGEMVIDGVLVRADYEPAILAGDRYLVFGFYRLGAMYCVPLGIGDDDRLMRTWPRESVADPGEPITSNGAELYEVLVGLALDDVRRLLASAK